MKSVSLTMHPIAHSLTTDEWMSTIKFLTRTGQTCTPLRQEFILLSDVLGVSALVDALNNPSNGIATESSVLGPFFTEDAPDGSSSTLHIYLANRSILVSRRLLQHIQSRSGSRSRLKERGSTCMSRVVCSLRLANPSWTR